MHALSQVSARFFTFRNYTRHFRCHLKPAPPAHLETNRNAIAVLSMNVCTCSCTRMQDERSAPADASDGELNERHAQQRAQRVADHRESECEWASLVEVVLHADDGRQTDEPQTETCHEIQVRWLCLDNCTHAPVTSPNDTNNHVTSGANAVASRPDVQTTVPHRDGGRQPNFATT